MIQDLNSGELLIYKDKSTISEHTANIYQEGELNREATVRNFPTVHFTSGAAYISF